MRDFDLKLAKRFKAMNQQKDQQMRESEQGEALTDGSVSHVEKATDYQDFIPQIKKNRVRLNRQNYTFDVYDFFDQKIKLSLRRNHFRPLFDEKEDQKVQFYHEQGSFFHMSLHERPMPYKSLIFYQLDLLQHYKEINVPVTWLKSEQTDDVLYVRYRIVAKDGPYHMIRFSGAITDHLSFDGSFIVPEGEQQQWLSVYEASLHLIKITKEVE
ncbi:MAG: hypothetical protein FWG67_02005 [Defluviitaleaceae bacterium]|nr:hypothetical protein [Defluviitaleaceae bacterium]